MKHDKAVSFSGKAGDHSSMDDVLERSEGSINRPPAEVLIGEKNREEAKAFSAWKELAALFKDLWKSKSARPILLLISIGLVALTFNVLGEIRMNEWQGAFFRGIEHKQLGEIGRQSVTFLAIMLILLCLVVSQNWVLERVKIRIRQWLTNHLLDGWMKRGVAYRLNMTSEERLNPDQRIQEDIANFSGMTGDLGMGAIRSALMLVCFVGVLWGLSRGIALHFGHYSLMIPGYMVWFALFYAVLGSYLAAKVGAPLIQMNGERYTREANFRYQVMRISDNAESISLYGGEADERRIANQRLESVLDILRTLSFANARLTWIACGHGWLVVILPVLVALPGYLQGKLDFGGLMRVVGAFNVVQQCLRWFVENFGRIADWQAALHRVVIFRDALQTVDQYDEGDQPDIIRLDQHPEQVLEFDQTSVTLFDGTVVISDATAKILPGERVLLTGESGSGKSTLLRAVGGLWPWGGGRILTPPTNEMLFLPQKPYIPLGTLAAAITYPDTARDWRRESLVEVLTKVNLAEFASQLDRTDRWDKVMSLGQQQRLGFARLLLHKPKWIFLDEATSALDDENQHRMMSFFMNELKDSALMSIGHRTGLEQYHTRTLELSQTPHGRKLTKKQSALNAAKYKKGILGQMISNLRPTAVDSKTIKKVDLPPERAA